MVPWANTPHSISEVLEWISSTSLGAQVVQAFFAMGRIKAVRIAGYPDEIRKRLNRVRKKNEPIGAAFVTDGTQGTIYVDLEQEAAVLGPFLLHEMVHSLDEALWQIAAEKVNQENREKVILESERKAFETQYLFIQEMRRKDPAFGQFLDKKYPRVAILQQALSREEIAKLYGLKAA